MSSIRRSRWLRRPRSPRRVYLEERKAVIYDNLRDLSFEHRAGKYRDEEYNFERAALEGEAAAVMVELEELRDR